MILGKHRFSDLDSIIDHLHALFQEWEQQIVQPSEAGSEIAPEVLHRTKLAAHEWLANLVQHADFPDHAPSVTVEVRQEGERLHCSIEDNSAWFDLDAQIEVRQEMLNAYPERGMGLLMLRACTEDLSYHRVDAERNRLEFAVSADQDPYLPLPF